MSYRGSSPGEFRGYREQPRDYSPERNYDFSPTSYSPKPRDRETDRDVYYRDEYRPYQIYPKDRSDRREERRDDSYRTFDEEMYSPRNRSENRFRDRKREMDEDAERYFERNKRSEWFRKQFHPIELRERRLLKQKSVQAAYDRFMKNIVFPDYSDEGLKLEDPYDGKRIMVISDQLTTSERMRDIAPLKENVEKVVISDPRYRKVSVGFVVYNTKEAADEAKKKQSEVERNQLTSVRSKEPQLRFAPKDFGDKERLDKDCAQLTQLVELMDQINGVKGISVNKVSQWDKWSTREKVDVQITYLRKVHSLCYYCLIEYADEEELYRRCTMHFRESEKTKESHLPPKTVHWFKNFDSYEYSFFISLKEENKSLAFEAQQRIIQNVFKDQECVVCRKKVEDQVKHAVKFHSNKVSPADMDEINDRFRINFLSDPKKKALPNY
ncbi:hypothetical protein EIN_079010 [Entamoeba invadens IP1]|uniref:hypothetical protein n=1 Tax=Entamoeba invadens IP1 TaxID=370355 RepID=UPI0002C3F829|nr:hypothetical protein EIN_079010 [Entamoeba invadens IP1]ELP84999.1 hypothetical protein EIN_079010 [Entamoeba invadens IP1]|eukprot:XP_004184345.1 hypothetical protein EIN_079010 [Entamoeba invadens IP1]